MNNWTETASIAACFSAFFSFIGICVNIHYNKKTYRANLEIKSKLELINSIKKLVPDYIAATNYALYLYYKGWANTNDKRQAKDGTLPPNVIIGEISLSDFDPQLTNAKTVYFELETNLNIYGCQSLLNDVEAVWNVLRHDNLNKLNSTATNQKISNEGTKIFNEFKETKNKLNKDLAQWYKWDFYNLIQ